MADEPKVTIQIDGRTVEARKGAMLIEAADAVGIDIPRFCYHKKLSVAANCRMCLVEVEKAPKPLPACATPVTEGMKVKTDSPLARAAQKGTMEFLLINHPLDCPICDQGGECELQDVAMGYGGDVSRYAERKRVVPNPDIGPLIATDMTRCIHCTRCVRFGEEIAGLRELGATGRGEHTTIGTYIKHAVASELSGNVIDLCPVGALTSKPYRFSARPWELRARPAVAPHDGVGANLWLHTRGNRVMRAVPRDNEAVNEVWIADRDRFGYLGLNSADRLLAPRVKRDGEWRDCDWSEALAAAVAGLKAALGDEGGSQLGVLAAPTATAEELFLLQQLARGLGCDNLDHRLRQGDFSAQAGDPRYPWLGLPIAELEQVDAALVIGSHLRKEQPLLAHRLRKAALGGAQVALLNPLDYPHPFPLAESLVAGPAALLDELVGIAAAAGAMLPLSIHQPEQPSDAQQALARLLRRGERSVLLLGALAQAHPAYGFITLVARAIAAATGSRIGFLLPAANSVGAALAGVLPHRGPGGSVREAPGLDARAMLEQPRRGYLLLGVEPQADCWDPQAARTALSAAAQVVALTPFVSPELLELADVLLPVAGFAESSGTFVNLGGSWQSWEGAVAPPGEARPAWKVLRVLGNQFGLDGFGYEAPGEVLAALRAACGELTADNAPASEVKPAPVRLPDGLLRVGEVPIYAGDALVRRAQALQRTPDAVTACIRLAPADAARLG
ncbi:MAG TPA: NADH-quinone oxidoreductase subunit NuoG, partial [Gammaproteobacteria bacterium]